MQAQFGMQRLLSPTVLAGMHGTHCMMSGCIHAQVAESEAVLACRLMSRKTEPLDKMITRVQTARQEMRHLRSFDFGARCAYLHCMANSPSC